MKEILIVLGLNVFVEMASGQSAGILLHSGTNAPYYGNMAFQDAYNAAASGDTIYLPIGFFPPPASINKGLIITGAGHFPDSTIAKGRTNILGNIVFFNESSGIVLEGVYISANIDFGTGSTNAAASNIRIIPCNVNTIGLSENGLNFRGAANVFIKDNVIRGDIRFAYVKTVVFETNIVAGQLLYVDGIASIRNNIFFRENKCRRENSGAA